MKKLSNLEDELTKRKALFNSYRIANGSILDKNNLLDQQEKLINNQFDKQQSSITKKLKRVLFRIR